MDEVVVAITSLRTSVGGRGGQHHRERVCRRHDGDRVDKNRAISFRTVVFEPQHCGISNRGEDGGVGSKSILRVSALPDYGGVDLHVEALVFAETRAVSEAELNDVC